MVARILSGLSAGGCFVAVPMYVKEISQDDVRGTLGSLLTLSQNLGVLIMYIIGTYMSYYGAIYSIIWLPFLSFLLLLKAPESPAYLLKIGKINVSIVFLGFLGYRTLKMKLFLLIKITNILFVFTNQLTVVGNDYRTFKKAETQ